MANKGGMPEGLKTTLLWVIGIGVIALTLLILAILFGNLSGNVGFGTESTTFDNDTITLTAAGETPATVSGKVNTVLTSVVVTNVTSGETLEASNYTIAGGVFTQNATGNYGGQDVNVSASATFDTVQKVDTDNIILNYTKSASNVAKQLPTVGIIIGVAILLLILIGVLIFAIRKLMGSADAASGRSNLSGGSAEFR